MRTIDRRVVAALCAAAPLTLAACGGGGGGGSAADQIRDVIRQSATVPDAATCTTIFTPQGIKALYNESTPAAARKDCLADARKTSGKPKAGDIGVSEVKVNGNRATANASYRGHSALFALVNQGGQWKIDNVRA